MTVLDRFFDFTKGLSGDRLDAIEEALAELMASHSDDYALSPDELAEIDRRLAEPRPNYASARDVEKLLGKPLPK